MNAVRTRWSNQTKLIVTLVLLAILAWLLHKFGQILIPLTFSAILAYVLSPAVNYLQKRLRIHRILAILLTYVALFMVIGTILMVVIPMIMGQLREIGRELYRLPYQANIWLGQQIMIAGIPVDIRDLVDRAISSLQTMLEPIFGGTITLIAKVVSSIAWVVFVIVISIYLIKNSDAMRTWFEKLAPPGYRDDFIALRSEIGTIWSAFFRSQLMLGLIVASLITILGIAIGLPYALLMGLLAGILEFIPSLGHGTWLVTALLLAFFRGSGWINIPNWGFALLVLGLTILFQQFDVNYLVPRIVGRSVRLPPLVVILGVVSGAAIAGVLGIMLAAPTIASLRVIGRYVYAELVNGEPFPQDAYSQLPAPDPFWWRKNPVKTPRTVE